MPSNILIIIGHPARKRKSYCECVAEIYGKSAFKAGHDVEKIKISDLSFNPILREGFQEETAREGDILNAMDRVVWADHLVFVYPLWQSMIPALLKGFMERLFTKSFAFDFSEGKKLPVKLLTGKTTRIIQAMATPSIVRHIYGAHHAANSLKSFLSFCGIGPVKITYLGLAEDLSEARAKKYQRKIHSLGAKAR